MHNVPGHVGKTMGINHVGDIRHIPIDAVPTAVPPIEIPNVTDIIEQSQSKIDKKSARMRKNRKNEKITCPTSPIEIRVGV